MRGVSPSRSKATLLNGRYDSCSLAVRHPLVYRHIDSIVLPLQWQYTDAHMSRLTLCLQFVSTLQPYHPTQLSDPG